MEPLIGLVLILSSWIFGFSDANDAQVLCIVLGVIVIMSGAMTDWRVSLARVIPLKVHFMTDLLVAAVLIVAPFILGYTGNGAATRFTIIAGVLEGIAALSTRWDPAEAEPDRVHTRSRSTTPGGHQL